MNKKYLALAVTALILTACGGGDKKNSSSANDGKGAIDLAEYFPSKSMTKTMAVVEREGSDLRRSHHDEIINVEGNITITTTIDTELTEKVDISDTNITTSDLEDNETWSTYRHADIGDTLYSLKNSESMDNDIAKITYNVNVNCKLKSKENKFEKNDNIYQGDLLKIECINDGSIVYDIKPEHTEIVAKDLNGTHNFYDISYVYLKKGLGEVAAINDNCIQDGILGVIDDRKLDTETCKKENVYIYEFYLP